MIAILLPVRTTRDQRRLIRSQWRVVDLPVPGSVLRWVLRSAVSRACRAERLVADPVPAQQIDVVGAVQEVLHRGRPVSGDTRGGAVEDAAVDAVRIVVRLEQERQ
jgi:hypothetical protein